MVRLDLVAGQLPADERVVRQILVERLDDEIAVVVGVGPIVILLVAVALGERAMSSQCRAQRSPKCGLDSRRSSSLS